ncbi:MAG: M20/M25/M40 family metallo-hydrolase [Pirellulales bacterium]|nr:M20/M25/M40 family metallo-hydrolase [Pirellulales bacterium]
MKRARAIVPLLSLIVMAAVVVAARSDEPIKTGSKQTDIEKIIELGKNDNRVMEHLEHLSNRIGPRLTGSDGLQRACEWAVEYFKSMGIENAHMEQWGEFPVGFERGPWFGRITKPVEENLMFGTNAWTAGTNGRQIGYAIMLPKTKAEWEAAEPKMKGAFVLAPRAARRSGRGRGRQNAGNQAAGGQDDDALSQAEATRMAQEAGIAGLVYPTRGDSGLIVTSGNYRVEWDNLPTIPRIDLLHTQWNSIAERLAAGEEVELEFDIRNFFKKGPIPLYNVIADIPGTEFPDEYVIVGGHIDSWDLATGAQDNGTGCSTTFECARLLMEAGIKPRRTIRFMLWSGEEQGLLGSRAYCQQNPDIVDKVSACLVHDGGTNYVAGIRCTPNMTAIMNEVFAPAMTLDERTQFTVEEVEALRGGGSDHASFIRAGAPGFFWAQAGRTSYTYVHHTQWDTYDSAVPEYQEHSSIVIALGAYGLAQLDEMLPRDMMNARGTGGRGPRRGGRTGGGRSGDGGGGDGF